MGWLERIRQTRTEIVAPIRGQVVRRGGDEQRFGLSQLMEMFSYAGVGYSTYGGDNSNVERDTNAFVHYVNSYYRDNGVIFAVILARMLLFTEARFQWQRVLNGRPGDLFGTNELNLLENPWPNGTTGELLGRMEQDVSLHGNFYAVRETDRLRRLRPDWVEIVLDAPPAEAVASNIKGYAYYPGGVNSRTTPKIYLPHEVAHWSPIPDPLAQYRGMSWITPVLREISGDRAASDHKLKFFENAATPNLAVSFSENITQQQFQAFMAAMNAAHQGTSNAYKTLYLGGGADVKTIGANMEQMDFKATQGAGETRICAAGGVPPVIVGLSEGLQSATYSNYGMARRKFGDHWARPQWRSACAALSTLVEVPRNARLWYDDRDIAFLREDQKDVASIQTQQASTMKQLIDAGFEPESVKKSMLNEDWSLLEHTGLFSVQLQPPGAAAPQGGPPSDTPPEAPGDTGKPEETGPPSEGGGDLTEAEETEPDGKISPAAIIAEQNALADLANQLTELRAMLGELTAERHHVGGKHPHDPKGSAAERAWNEADHPEPDQAERGRSRTWNEADHPRGPDGKFAGSGMSLDATDHGLTIVDSEFTGTTGDDAWLASTDVPTRAAELWANRFEDMRAIRSAMRGEQVQPYKSKRIRDWDDEVIYGPQDRVKDVRVAADYLRERIREADQVDYPLHRGMGLSGDALKTFTTPGSEFDSDVISWTDRPDAAGNYAKRHAESEGGVPVVLTLTQGAHAFNLDGILTGKTKGGGEHLTGGKYRVVSSTRNATGGWDVTVEEVGRA